MRFAVLFWLGWSFVMGLSANWLSNNLPVMWVIVVWASYGLLALVEGSRTIEKVIASEVERRADTFVEDLIAKLETPSTPSAGPRGEGQ